MRAWRGWQATFDRHGPIDGLTFPLLPLLYCNLLAHGADAAAIAWLKGLYRNAWYRNNRLLHGVSPLLAALHDAGFRLLFLNGLHLSRDCYPMPGARPIGAVDVMVPIEQAEAVIGWMDRHEYPRHWTQVDGGTDYRHAIVYRVGDFEVGIHWHLLPDCQDPTLAGMVWERARPFELNGVQGQCLAPADLLFHQLLRGMRWDEEPAIQWLADVGIVLRFHSDEIEWDRLVNLCGRFAYSERCHLALRFLRDALGAAVPDDVLAALARGGGALVERLERTFVLRDHEAMYAHPLGKLWITFAEFQGLGRRRKFLPRFRGFSRFAAVRWHAKGRLDMLAALTRHSRRRARQ